MSASLEFEGAAFRYSGGVGGIEPVDFEIHPGSLVALLGPNGSGKSTLLKLAVRVLTPQVGVIRYAGEDIAHIPAKQYARWVGYLPQTPDVSFSMRAIDLVLSGRAPYLSRFGWESEADLRIARNALERCDAGTLGDRLMDELSGGERKRVFLARVLAGEPRLIVLDEPLAALDPRHTDELLALLRKIVSEESTAVLFVSHDINSAIGHADRALVLSEGRLVFDSDPHELLDPQRIEQYFGLRVAVATSDDGRRWLVPAGPSAS